MTFYEKIDELGRYALKDLGAAFRFLPHTLPITLFCFVLYFAITLGYTVLSQKFVFGHAGFPEFSNLLKIACFNSFMSAPIIFSFSTRATHYRIIHGHFPVIRDWLKISDVAVVLGYFGVYILLSACAIFIFPLGADGNAMAFFVILLLIALALPVFVFKRSKHIIPSNILLREGKILYYVYITFMNLLITLFLFFGWKTFVTFDNSISISLVLLFLFTQQFLVGSILVRTHFDPQLPSTPGDHAELLDNLTQDDQMVDL